MKLIAEFENNNVGLITEELDENGNKSMYIAGIFAQAEKENRNRRIYPKSVLESAISKYIDEYVSVNRAIGELNHPASATPNPERACILIKELRWNGNDVYGKAKVLSTPQGEIVKSLLKDGVQLGVSTRGLGSINEKKGASIVEDDYTISAIDVVSNPSGIDCWVNGILENTEYYYQNGVLTESSIDEYNKHLKRGSIKDLRIDFAKFIQKINNNK